MKSNLFTGFLLSISLLPSLLFAQESEFVEDRSNTVVEFAESEQKTSESTEVVVKDNDVKKSDIDDSFKIRSLLLGARLGGMFALPLGMSMTDEVQKNHEEADATWLGAKAGVGAALCVYFYQKMALVTGLDYQLLYYKTTDQVPRNRVITVTGTEYHVDGWSGVKEPRRVSKTSSQDRSITYHQVSVPVSFRYHFLDDLWGQLGVGLGWNLKGKGVYESSITKATIEVQGYYQPNSQISIPQYGTTYRSQPPIEEPVKKEFIPSLLLSVGKSWTLGKWNLDAALSFSYALKKIDFDYGLSANTFTIGLDFYAWYSLTKEKK
ncbi:MAG: hypothetical protein SPL52_01905 [Fibrobacter sp.]|nr:hypothetical protein [Fibrobacter sp.]